jgi:mono/diheme cytochrome c family protein
MAISFMTVAYGTVAVAGIALLVSGTPAEHSVAAQARMAAEKPVTPAYEVALNRQVAAYAAAVGPHAAPAMVEAAGVKLRSVGFDLPTGDSTFPPGPGAELVTNNCQACHSPGMILNQPALTRAEWTGEVNKMRNTYKAPVSEDDAAGIVSYLASLKVAP